MYFKFHNTPTIAMYFPQLLRREWWQGYEDTLNNTVHLIDDGETQILPEAIKSLVISSVDVEARKEKLTD